MKQPFSFMHSLFLFFITLLVCTGCANPDGPYMRDGREYGTTNANFKGHWWEYYERGRSFSNGIFYSQAIADFQKAIEGNETDNWHTPTSDKHVIDYFPHRELGIVYLKRKQFDLAIAELENSIQSAPSAKAHFFLNKARAAKLRMNENDISAPEVHIQGSSTTTITNSFAHTITGVALDDTYVASIQLNDYLVPLELAEKQRVFKVELPLQEGKNTIAITATDLLKKKTIQNHEVLCDRQGPIIEILQVAQKGDTKYAHGVISDNHGLQTVKINGRPWKISGTHAAYNFKFPLDGDGTTLVAADRAGNITRATLQDEEIKDDPLLHPRIAHLEPPSLSSRPSRIVPDTYQPLLAATKTHPVDLEPPFILLNDHVFQNETYDAFFLLEGRIFDSSPIHLVSLNNEQLPNKKGNKLFFSHLKKLEEGNNVFVIEAVDVHGNQSEKTITINRKVKNIHQIKSRMSVAVIPFEHLGDTTSLQELVHDTLIDSLEEQKRFNLIERKTINSVLKELKGSTSITTRINAADLGRIVDADTVLTGSIIESPDSIEIIARLLDTETGTILATKDIFGEDKNALSIDNLLDMLAYKFKMDFPIFKGILVEVGNNKVIIDAGSDKQVKQNQRVLCYRDGLEIKHPVTGNIFDAEPDILGELKVMEVFKESSLAIQRNPASKMRKYDRIIAK